MMLRIILELLGNGGIAKEEAEGGENVLTRGRKRGHLWNPIKTCRHFELFETVETAVWLSQVGKCGQ